jgi:membrane glycosyltransferase
LTFWQLGESNYWGHNAIVRLRPFAEYCSLPHLRGAPPFGGEILSHDIVEAALMRRAGYRIWLVPDIAGSWEEVPTNVIDFAARDRRWAQGNLQHLGVMPMPGLHWLSRIHMLTGVLSYVTSPHVAAGADPEFDRDQHRGGHGPSVLPAGGAFAVSLLAAISRRRNRRAAVDDRDHIIRAEDARRGAGARQSSVAGRLRRRPPALEGVLFEQFMSMLLAPTMMLFHTSFVLRALLGRSVGWDAQPRGDRGISWREGLVRHKWHLALGLLWGGAILALAPKFIWWMMPVLAGMLIAVPFTVLTSRASLGRALRERGWLLTPEETRRRQNWRRSLNRPPRTSRAGARPGRCDRRAVRARAAAGALGHGHRASRPTWSSRRAPPDAARPDAARPDAARPDASSFSRYGSRGSRPRRVSSSRRP